MPPKKGGKTCAHSLCWPPRLPWPCTAHLVNGVANVRIDRTFESAIDGSSYYVFLTPVGATRGLYVSKKTPGGFEVREAQEGRSTLSFDYRIFARPLDAPKDRLPPAPPFRNPAKLVHA